MAPKSSPRSSRKSTAPSVPPEVAAALGSVRKEPSDLALWDALEDAARETGHPDEVLALYDELVASSLPAELRVELGLRAATFTEEWTEETEPVIVILARLLEIDPGATAAFERLTLLYTVAGRFQELLATYDRAILAAESGDKKARLLEEAARVARDFAGAAARGTDYLLGLFELKPASEQLAMTLEKRLVDEARHADLVRFLTLRMPSLPGDARLATLLRSAELRIDRTAEFEAAFSVLSDFLAGGGELRAAADLLGRLARSEQAPVEVRRAALERLVEIDGQLGEAAAVRSSLEFLLALADDDERRIALHRRLAAHLDQSAPEDALGHLARVLLLAPSSSTDRDLARRLAERSLAFGPFVDALVRAADSGRASPEERVDYLAEAANTTLVRLGDRPSGIRLHERVLDEPSAGPSARLLAATELAKLHHEAGDLGRALGFVELEAELEDKLSARRSAFVLAAGLATELGEIDRALRHWQSALDIDDDDIDAHSARVALLTSAGRPLELAGFLLCRAKRHGDPSLARADYVEAARLVTTEANDYEQALGIWKNIEDEFGRNYETVDAVLALHERCGRFGDAAELLADSLEREQAPARRLWAAQRLGTVLVARLDAPERAVVAFERGLALAPADVECQAALLELATHAEVGARAAEALAVALASADMREQLLDLSEVRLQAAVSDAERARILVESAHVADGLGLGSRALGLLARAFPLSPTTGIEGDLLRLAEATGEFVPVARAYADAVQAVSDRTKARTLLLAEGEIHASRLGDQKAATRAFRRAVEIEPSSAHAVRALVVAAVLAGEPEEAAHGIVRYVLSHGHLDEEILGAFEQAVVESGGDWETNLRALLDAVVSEEALDGALEHALKRRVASWYRDRGADPDSAELILRRAVAKHPEESSLVMLADLERRVPGRPLVATLLSLSSLRGGDLAVLREAGEVAQGTVQDDSLAAPVLELARETASSRWRAAEAEGEVLAVDESEPAAAPNVVRWATLGLVEAYLASGVAERAVSVLVEQAGHSFPDPERLRALVRAAELAERAGDTERAVSIARSGLEIAPDDRTTLALLGRLHEGRGDLEPFVAVRRRELELEGDVEQRVALQLSLARALTALGPDPSAAIDALTAAVAEAPGRSEAVEALGELLVRAARNDEAAAHYEAQAPLVARVDRARAARMWMEAARLLDDLSERERARRAYRASFQAAPNRQAAARLAAHAASDGQVAERVEWLERQLELEPPATEAGSERRTVVAELASALVTLEDEARAKKLLETELVLDPEANSHREILVGLYRAEDDHESLFRVLVDRSRYETSSGAQVEALLAAARVARGMLGSERDATPLLERALLLDSNSREVRTELAENLLAVGRVAEARDVLGGLLAEFGRRRVRERALLHCLLARIESALGNVGEAIVQADEAAKIERTDPDILGLVGKLALEGGDLDKAEQAYRTLALVAGRGAGGAGAESVILYELHGIAHRRGEQDKASELLASALEIAGRSPSEALRLDESLRRDGREQLLIEALLASEITADGERRAELASARATVIERGGELERALEVRLSAMHFGVSDAKVLDAARRLADAVGAPERYRSVLVELASAAEGTPEIAVELWTRLGREGEARGDRDQALGYLERALETGLKVRRTFSLLEPLLQGAGDRVRLERVLERMLAASEAELTDQLRSQSLYRLAELRLGHGDEARGLAALLQATEVLPDHESTLRILGPLLDTSEGARRELAPVYFEAARLAGTPREQLFAALVWSESAEPSLDVLREGLALARDLGDETARRTLLSKLTSKARSSGAILASRVELLEYVELLERSGEIAEAIDVQRTLAAAEEGDERLALELRAAEWLVERLGDWTRATSVYESLLAIAPVDRRVFGPLFRGLRTLGHAERIEEHLETIEPLATDEDDAHLLRMERVRLEIEAGRSERAELVLREVLAARPHDAEAESVLTDLLARAGRTDELRRLYQDALAAAVSVGALDRVETAALSLVELEPSEREESIRVLSSALGHARGSRALMRALFTLYTEDDDPFERADLLEKLVPLESGAERERLAALLIALREAAGDEYGTDRAFDIAYSVAPTEELALRYVERLRDKEDLSRLVEVLLELAARGGPSAAARTIEAGELLDTRLGEPARAARVFASASKLAPEDFSLVERAVELLSTAGDVDEALALLAKIIEAGDDLVLGDALDLRAKVLVRERGDEASSLEVARKDLERALEQLLPEDQEDAIHRRLIDIIERNYVAAEDYGNVELARELAFTLADRREARGELEDAIAALSRFVDAHPEDTATLRRVSDLATTAGDHSAALAARLRLFDVVPDSERAPVALAAFDAAMGLGEPMSAQVQLLAVLSERPDHPEVRRAVERMYEAVGAYRPLADLMVQEARRAADAAVRSSLLLTAGDLYLRAEDQRAALAALEEAARLGGENYAVTAKLADAYLGLGEYERATEALEAAVTKHGKRRTPELAVLQFALGRVADAREDVDAMLNWLETALMTDRNNGDVASMLAARAHELGRNDVALRALQAVTLLKGDAPMSKAEAYFRQAQIASGEGDQRKALLLARRAVQADAAFAPAHELVERLA